MVANITKLMSVSTIAIYIYKLVTFAIKGFLWYIIISVLWRDWIAMFKVKVTVKADHISAYLLVLLLFFCVTATKLCVLCTITDKREGGGNFAVHGTKPCLQWVNISTRCDLIPWWFLLLLLCFG